MSHLPADHPPVAKPRVGIVIANLGTPDATDYWSMRRYLSEFLGDRRVIDLPAWKWQPILQGIILTIRPFASGKKYDSIWNKDRNESPLLTITRAQCEGLDAVLKAEYGDEVMIDFAMRYGNPSTGSVLEKLQKAGCNHIVFFPLYPQYAAPTTATANDQAFRALLQMRWQPAIRTVPAYFDDPAYIGVLGGSIASALASLPQQPEKLIMSYHGVPERYLLAGDPYHCQCLKTSRLVRESLGSGAPEIISTFQSKFGREKWIGPATIDKVTELARSGIRRIAIAAPAFSADCVETLEEIDMEIRHAFLSAGGEVFTYIRCLNDDTAHIALLADIIRREAAGWL